MCVPIRLSDGLEAAAGEGGGGCERGFEEACSVVGAGRSVCVEGAVEVGDWMPGVAVAGSGAGAAAGRGSGGLGVATAGVWPGWMEPGGT